MVESLENKLPEGLKLIGNSVYVDTKYPSLKDVIKRDSTFTDYVQGLNIRFDEFIKKIL